jgi:hypothetical protein
MKKLLLLLLVASNFAIGQNRLLLSPNGIEIRNNATGVLLRKLSNVIAVEPTTNLANYITVTNVSSKFDINYATVTVYSVNGGALTAPTSLNSFMELIQSICVVRLVGAGGGGGGGGDASASNQLSGNATLVEIAQNQLNQNSNLIDIKANTTIQKGSVVQTDTTITLGGTQQTALALNANRTGFEVINNSTTPIYINFSGLATINSLEIQPNSSYSRYTGKIPTNAISVLGATTGQQITILEQN